MSLIEQERERIQLVLTTYGGPSKWRCLERGADGEAWQLMGLRVIWSVAQELDDRHWLHVSASREVSLPSYSDMAMVKRLVVGPRRMALSVWADDEHHVNLHPNVLHLWTPLDGQWPLPDFTRGLGTI